MKPINWRLYKAFVPVVVGIRIVGGAYWNYTQTPITVPILNRMKFKLGVDLVGGTILVYEIDPDKKPENYNKDQLVAALKRRLDPADLYNITIRPLSDTRVEIILPTGGRHRSHLQAQAWQELLTKVADKYEIKGPLTARRGDVATLTGEITRLSGATAADVDKYIKDNYAGEKQKELTGEEVEKIKDLIQRVGSLEFRILANRHDDDAAVKAAEEYFKAASESWDRF